MSDLRGVKSDLAGSISELESLGLETAKLNELNDSYEVENLVENIIIILVMSFFSQDTARDQEYYTDWLPNASDPIYLRPF